jgi:hypothetical protein
MEFGERGYRSGFRERALYVGRRNVKGTASPLDGRALRISLVWDRHADKQMVFAMESMRFDFRRQCSRFDLVLMKLCTKRRRISAPEGNDGEYYED